ncbi:MAG: 16S rRNA (guanine(966)-N(2))-methyltransferase RsmD [Acidimicrobiaceae bacterium]|nr:16S rRNA (guanine(966)-N(2))-methyltransferase RsmD [Acidimicrobiaceae bacterium]
MRVVAGTAKGRRLASPPTDASRPTPNRVREAVFNSLYSLNAVEGARVLDLFAGTGAMGIEALSRGAAEAVFVENDPAVAGLLRDNLELTRLADRAAVMVVDADAALIRLARGPRFDVALVDPPYAFDDWPDLLSRVPAELVVAESDRPVDVGPGFAIHHHKRHGGTVVTFAQAASGGPILTGAEQ